jgi:hypothetical protein
MATLVVRAGMTQREPLPQTMLLAACCLILLALPFVTTYNDLLTVGAMHSGLAGALQSVSPFEARMVVALLRTIGVQAAATGSQLVVIGPGGPTNLSFRGTASAGRAWSCSA